MILSKFKKNLFEFYFVFVLIAVLSPKFNAVDNASIRWLTLSLINIAFLCYSMINKKTYYLKDSNVLKIFSALFFISAISALNSVNINESLISLNKIFIVLSTIVCVSIFSSKEKSFQSLTYFLFISVLFESSYVFYDYITSADLNFTGVSMNRNISAFSILIKLPFFFIYKSINQNQNKPLSLLQEIIIISSIIILESRAAIVVLIIIYLLKTAFTKDKLKSIITIFLSVLSLIIYYPFSRILQNKSLGANIISDESLNLRLDFFSTSIELFFNNPIIGNGIGMWKILSNQMLTSLVPYYVHNDFLQFLMETGIIGFTLYIFFFISVFYLIKKNWNNNSFYFLMAVIIFLIDSFINFPFHRPQQIIIFILIIGLLINSSNSSNINFNKSLLIAMIFPLLFSIYISFKVVKSSFLENTLRLDLMKKEYSINVNDLSKIDYKFPNLSSNTVPFSSYLARYYINNNDFENADVLIEYGINSNPFISYSKDLKLQSLLMQNKFIQALRQVKLLLKNSNDSELYFDIFFNICLSLNLEQELINIYPLINDSNNEVLIVKFFKNYTGLQQYDKEIYRDLIIKEIIRYPENDDLNQLYNKVK
jgi:O-antigen ligase